MNLLSGPRLTVAYLYLVAVAVAAGPGTVAVPATTTTPHSKPATAGDAVLRVVSSSSQQVELVFKPGELQIDRNARGVALRAHGADPLAQPGEPDLPGRVVLVGVPQTGAIELEVYPGPTEVRHDLVIRPAVDFSPSPPQARAMYEQDRFWPAALAEIVGIFTLRGVRVARVRLNPVQYNPKTGETRFHRELRVMVRFADEPRKRVGTGKPDAMLERMLVNGDEARFWSVDEPGLDTDSVNFFDRYTDWCKVKTETTGVYRVTGAELAEAGFVTIGIDPAALRLFTIGEYTVNEHYPDTMVEVPVIVHDGGDGSFDAGDYVAFYAESPSTWKTDTAGNTYWHTNYFTRYRHWWLTSGDGYGRRMETRSGAGATNPSLVASNRIRLEDDRLCPARSGLLWLWDRYIKVAGRDTGLFRRELDIPNRDTIYEISGRVYGAKHRDNPTLRYYVRLYLNDVELDTMVVTPLATVPPPRDFICDVPTPAGTREGLADTLTFELYGDPETTIYLDYLEVRYAGKLELSGSVPFIEFEFDDGGTKEIGIAGADGDVLLLDVTDPLSVVRITETSVTGGRRDAKLNVEAGARFVCALTSHLRRPLAVERRFPGMLRGPGDGADYYVVCPDEFHAAARGYARYRDGNIADIPGARAEAVQLSDIYDEYAFGMEEPGAIKKFLATKQPDYTLFAGDATYDYRNCLDQERPPSMPAYEIGFDIDPEVYGQLAKAYDAWYADFDGNGSGPDMMLGRITCRSAVELSQYRQKVETYETQPLGYWAKRFLLLADDEYEGSPDRPDPIGFSHITGCEGVYGYARGLLDPVKIYLTEYVLTGVNDKADARRELSDRLEQGALFWCFFGHGAGFQLTHERVLNIDGVAAVKGETRTPIAFFGSCGVGRYEDTRYEAIAEELVRKPEGGCIVTTAATKATTSGNNQRFANTMYSEMLAHPGSPIGPAYLKAWLTYTLYLLFGDPALVPRIPAPGFEPVVTPDTLHPGGLHTVTDSVATGQGMYGITVHELDWFRHYFSDVGATSYILPGYEVHTAIGTFENGRIDCQFRMPKLDYPDTLIVPNGSYVRMPGTASVSFLAWDETAGYGSVRDVMELGDPVTTQDNDPPVLLLYADGIELATEDTLYVPQEFVLTGVLEDESGILLAPVADYGLSLVRGGTSAERVGLHTRFFYDQNSVTRGRFTYPLDVGQEQDSITVFASDNVRNRLVATYYIKTRLNQALKLDSCLVYPNPVASHGYFTFALSKAAFVSVKVYTIAGRLVRRLPAQPCGFGYNQLYWDGRDEYGTQLPNGVYLYKLDARSSEVSGGNYATAHRDRFLIHR